MPTPSWLQTIETDALGLIAKSQPILSLLVGFGIVKTSTGTEVETVLNDVNAVLSGTHQPTSALVSSLNQLLTDLKTDGVLSGPLVDALQSGASQTTQFLNDIHSGQPGILKAHVGIDGVDCSIQAVPYGGAVAGSEGLS